MSPNGWNEPNKPRWLLRYCSLGTTVCRHKRAFLHKVHDFRLIRRSACMRLVTGPVTQHAKPPQLHRRHGGYARVVAAVLIWARPQC